MTKLEKAEQARRSMMKTKVSSVQNEATRSAHLLDAANGLALVRVTIGSMFVWVFFENLGKGLYSPGGYAGLISYYIKSSHSPAVWKAVMGLMASHAAIAAPLQAVTEISLGILLVIGLLTRPAAFVAFLFLGSLWLSELGTSWIWELLVPVVASLGLAVGDGALTRGWHNGGRPRCGGDRAKFTCACRSSFPPTMKRRRSPAFLQICPLISAQR
jgi:uncharacterized membrane protein YphA (DoxX/SURF4 family)